jgi:benzoyl-CoA reductase subunit B
MSSDDKNKAINRLKSTYPLRDKIDETYRKSIEASREGKPTVWAMINFYMGDPILKAMDVEVVYPENYGTLLAASGVAQQYLDQSDADGFPNHLCGYCRCDLGYVSRVKQLKGQIPPDAPLGGMPKPLFLLSSTAICDARYKMFQAMGRYMDTPVWTLEAPTPGVNEFFLEGCYEKAVELGVIQLKEFIAFVERALGKKMDWDKLDEIVDLMIEINRVWYEINELRRAKPCPMHSRDFWSSMSGALFLAGDLKDSLLLYKDMYNEVKSRVDNHIGAVANEKYRLILAELPPWHSLKFFDKLAERGWNFVIESFAYQPPVPLDLTRIKDPLERISRFHLQFYAAQYRAARENNILLSVTPYLGWARDRACDGALLHSVMTCRSASGNLPPLSNMLMDKLKVPSLHIEGDIVDLRLFNPDDALAKAEPFEETMEHFREVRKQVGYIW